MHMRASCVRDRACALHLGRVTESLLDHILHKGCRKLVIPCPVITVLQFTCLHLVATMIRMHVCTCVRYV